jgi:eukaryotic-like serine/threonine-protein kinase
MSLLTSTSIHLGELLDHYRIEDLVSTGGMASIFRATDTKTGRPVAIKVPHPQKQSDRLALDHFRFETEIGRKFDHPGLVKVLSSDGARFRYAVMEWVEGRLLREIMNEQEGLPIGRTVRIALAICDVLEYVHARGIVHADLKPENVIVDGADNVKLIDFGIARDRKISLWRLARPKESMGTPDYASPEQIKGKRGDARSDIYSLGILLFEMLTGEVPFSGLDPATAMNLRTFADAPHVSEINPDIPPALEAVVQRALARDRAHRFASARELACSLSELLIEESEHQPLESFANV